MSAKQRLKILPDTADWHYDQVPHLLKGFAQESASATIQGLSNVKTITLFGDSFTAYQKTSGNDNDSTRAASCWAFILSNLSGSVTVNTYAGIGGNNSKQMLDRLQADVLSKGDDFVFGQVGVNDFYGYGFTAQQVFDNVTEMINQIIANGQSVVWLNCPPQNTARAGFTKAKSLESVKYNKMLEDWAETKTSITIVDVYSDLVNRRDSTNGAAKPDVISTDNIHLSTYGSMLYADSFARDAGHLFAKSKNKALSSPLDTNLVNGSFSGNTGSAGTNTTGTIPTGWILSAQEGLATVGSLTEDGFKVDTTITAADKKYVRLQSANLSGSFSGGEKVKLKAAIDLSSEGVSINEIRFYIYSAGTGFTTMDWGRVSNGYTNTPPINRVINIETNPYTIKASPRDVRVYADIRYSGTGTSKVLFKSLSLEIV